MTVAVPPLVFESSSDVALAVNVIVTVAAARALACPWNGEAAELSTNLSAPRPR